MPMFQPKPSVSSYKPAFSVRALCSLTEPENIGCCVLGLGLERRTLELGPLGTDKGVGGLDMISWP